MTPHFFSCWNLSRLESDGFGDCVNAEAPGESVRRRENDSSGQVRVSVWEFREAMDDLGDSSPCKRPESA